MIKTGWCVVLWSLVWSTCASAQTDFERVFPSLSFDQPVDLQPAGDGSGRLFVVEKPGRIWIIDAGDVNTDRRLFLDITGRVRDNGSEEGLLGLAFHPEYEQNGYFFVNYTASNPRRSIIARYSVDPSDAERALADSETVVLTVEQPYGNHNAGQLAFGPDDGFLYIGFGDGGSFGDPGDEAEDPTTLLGSMLRIDVDPPEGEGPYAIPDDNPFVGNGEGFREEIYAYGLRNPWRYSFDPATGLLWVADVGQNAYEEINLLEAGQDYGWDRREGPACYEPPSGCPESGLEPPIHFYSHSLGQSITGGYVYRGARHPELTGRYFYADYVSGRIWTLQYDGSTVTDNTLLEQRISGISTFGVDEDGELYLATLGGRLYTLAPTGTSTENDEVPDRAVLSEPYPNPFRDETTLVFDVSHPAEVTVTFYDAQGKPVDERRLGYLESGTQTLRWDGHLASGQPLASGVYLVQLTVDGTPVTSKPVTILR